MKIEKLCSNDFEELVDFINLVFSQNSEPHNFKKLQPRCIRPEYMEYVYAVRRNGRIRAAVMAAPSVVHAGGMTLDFYGIGNVATHIDERGSGLMSLLMQEITENTPADYSGLGGYRQRYSHFGYEVCGSDFAGALSSRNVRFTMQGKMLPTLRKIESAEDPALPEIRRMYEQKPLWTERGSREDFYRFLTMWRASPYAAYDENGSFCGYLCLMGNSVREYAADTPEQLPALFAASIPFGGSDAVSFRLAPWEWDALRALDPLCESISIIPDRLFRIENWDRVTEAFMKLKAETQPLMNGEAVIGIRGWGNLAIRVSGSDISCERSQLPASFDLTKSEAAKLLFGPLPPCSVRSSLPAPLTQWLPLPLRSHQQDNV